MQLLHLEKLLLESQLLGGHLLLLFRLFSSMLLLEKLKLQLFLLFFIKFLKLLLLKHEGLLLLEENLELLGAQHLLLEDLLHLLRSDNLRCHHSH